MSLLNKKILFVHINKSCGGVITKNFSKNGETLITNCHRTLIDMLNIAKNKYNIDKNELFIFTIVRNPWERMLSMYLFYHKNNYNCPEFFSGDEHIDDDFNKWIQYIYSSKFDKTRIHGGVNIFTHCFSNQLNWVKDSDNNIIKNINIYKIEDLDLDFFLKNTLGLSNVDSETRVHSTKHNHYSNYYNDESIKLVKNHYIEDIEFFGYQYQYKLN